MGERPRNPKKSKEYVMGEFFGEFGYVEFPDQSSILLPLKVMEEAGLPRVVAAEDIADHPLLEALLQNSTDPNDN